MSVRSTTRRSLLVPLAVAVAALAGGALAGAAGAGAEEFTPVAASVVAPPQPVVGSDGRVHLAYELLLVNRSFGPAATATVTGVTALARGRAVAALHGDALAAVTFPLGHAGGSAVLAPGESISGAIRFISRSV